MFLGSATGLSANYVWSATGTPAVVGAQIPNVDKFGYSVDGAGDVNGDGFNDVIIGAWGYPKLNGAGTPNTQSGRVLVYYGNNSAQGLSTNPDWISYATFISANYGFSVASAGDVNGDGFGDIIIKHQPILLHQVPFLFSTVVVQD